MAEQPLFELEMQVRAYECDLQQIVNNAVYQNYCEHARHAFVESVGLDVADLHRRGVDLVVTRAELDYHSSLRSRDRFVVVVEVERRGRLRYIFQQRIFRLPERQPILSAVFQLATLENGRPAVVAEVEAALEANHQTTPASSGSNT